LVMGAATLGLVAAPALADQAPNTYTNGQGYYGGQIFWAQTYADTGSYPQSQGGEFTVYSTGGDGLLLGNGAYAETTRGIVSGESFQTFCVEWNEHIYWNQSLNIWVSESATTSPDVYGSGSHAWQGGVPDVGDDLDPKTAYLYHQFAKGVLSNYTYAPNTGRATSAGQLQLALWAIEGEYGNPGTLTGQALTWYNEALEATTLGNDNAITWAGIGDVRVLQGYVGNDFRQDQLYVVPLPAAVLLGMLGLAAAGLKLRKFV